MDNQILLALIGLFGGIITMIIKSYIDKKDTKKSIDRQEKNVTERLAFIENMVTQMHMSLDRLITDNEFRNNFKNSLRVKINELLKAGMIEGHHRNILSIVQIHIEDFGLKYFYSSYRKNEKKQLENYLTNEYNIRREQINELILDKFQEPRYNGGKKIFFHELLKLSKINAASEMLIMRLTKNGFTSENLNELIILFEEYLETLYFSYMSALQLWHTYSDSHDL